MAITFSNGANNLVDNSQIPYSEFEQLIQDILENVVLDFSGTDTNFTNVIIQPAYYLESFSKLNAQNSTNCILSYAFDPSLANPYYDSRNLVKSWSVNYNIYITLSEDTIANRKKIKDMSKKVINALCQNKTVATDSLDTNYFTGGTYKTDLFLNGQNDEPNINIEEINQSNYLTSNFSITFQIYQ